MFIVLIAFSCQVQAHHGNAAFDTSKRINIKGTVVGWLWANPHCVLTFDAKNDQGNVIHWAGEATSPSDMTKNGWSKNLLHPGDEVTVTLTPAKNGRPIGRIEKVVLADGRALSSGIPPDSPTETKP